MNVFFNGQLNVKLREDKIGKADYNGFWDFFFFQFVQGEVKVLLGHIVSLLIMRAYFIHLLNRKKTLTFRNETRCTTFLVKMSFICMRMKNHFHIKGWALNLVLIQRPGETRKWPIKLTNHIYFTKSLLLFPRPHFFKRRINKASLSSIKTF